MYPSIVLVRPNRRALPITLLLGLALISWLCLIALATPFDHDESQYIAGAYFSNKLLIFKDFIYLQPPVHAWAYAPIAALFPTQMVVLMRLMTALTALLTLGALGAAMRHAGISRGSAAIATVLIGVTAAFQFAASVVRNDMLPMLFCAVAMMLALRALRECGLWFWGLSGLFFGLAIATKLSFAPVGLAAGLYVLTQSRAGGLRAASAFAAGGVAGVVPMLASWAAAPAGFLYGVVTFAVTGPFAWYTANGAGGELDMGDKIVDLLRFLVQGPALIALLLVLGNACRMRAQVSAPGRRFALFLLAGGMIGAAMPTPSHVQYLAPLLPPLAVGLGFFLDDARHWQRRWREAAMALLCLAAIPGLAEATGHVATMVRDGSPVLAAARGADYARDVVRRLRPDDEVVTLSPQQIIGSGLELDPRFSAGPFVYRTGWAMTQAQARALNAMTPATLPDLDRDPPDAILVGYENGTRKLPLRPDDSLIAYARSRAYRLFAMPDGIGSLYVKTDASVLHPRHPPKILR